MVRHGGVQQLRGQKKTGSTARGAVTVGTRAGDTVDNISDSVAP